MTRRLFPDNDAWQDDARLAGNEISVALMDLLAALEVDGPIDLKDFHFLVTQVTGSFVAELSIHRRLNNPAAAPRPIVRHYPRFSNQGERRRIGGANVKLLPEVVAW